MLKKSPVTLAAVRDASTWEEVLNSMIKFFVLDGLPS